MSPRPLLIVVLAAGEGTRMKSALPKVLHKIAGRSMLGHVLALARDLAPKSLAVVIGPGMEDVRAEALREAPMAQVLVQAERKGTADAVLTAREALAQHKGDVLVLYADTPLLTTDALRRVMGSLDQGAGIAVLGFEAADPTGYGRLLTDPGAWLMAIREERDASESERRIRLCNSGVMGFRLDDLLGVLGRIGNANAKGEFYLTDAVEIARKGAVRAGVVVCAEEEVLGVNSRDQLAAAEAIFQTRARLSAMREGATLIAPETVWLAYDTKLGRDVIIEPNVFFGPGVTVEDGAEIKANCHIEHSHIGPGARVGPFARLRPGATLGPEVHIGNFVEVKNSRIEKGAKANHLTYLGDARVGPGANIGAGTITCNYDGFDKHHTDIGAGAFIGSNSALVAPVTIPDGVYVGAGSVITRPMGKDSLVVTRAEQKEIPGWAEQFRTRKKAEKAAKKK
jgi:bifunctional UDP-N-acetylglucosamine pyrophosphorylase/glucosamine-1-phosphate N-acetyltransferase